MDLESTLSRAEVLFKRFQRLVEAVDKKSNFPTPRQELKSSSQDPEASSVTANGSSNKDKSKGKNKAKDMPSAEKVITPELRKLLSRRVEVLPRETVAKKGDGMPERG